MELNLEMRPNRDDFSWEVEGNDKCQTHTNIKHYNVVTTLK